MMNRALIHSLGLMAFFCSAAILAPEAPGNYVIVYVSEREVRAELERRRGAPGPVSVQPA